MTKPTDGMPADDKPGDATSGTPAVHTSIDATRPVPQDQTTAIPAGYAYLAPSPQTADAIDRTEGTPFTDEPARRGRRSTGLALGAVAAVSAVAALGASEVLL